MPHEVILIRHGQSEANAGWSTDPDSGLTPLGIEQSRRLGRQLQAMDLSSFIGLVSPYRRTLGTAQEITAACGFPFRLREQIREWGPTAEVAGNVYHLEPIDDVVTRLRNFMAEHSDRKLVIVSHATPIALLTELMQGKPPTTTGPFWQAVTNACLLRCTRE